MTSSGVALGSIELSSRGSRADARTGTAECSGRRRPSGGCADGRQRDQSLCASEAQIEEAREHFRKGKALYDREPATVSTRSRPGAENLRRADVAGVDDQVDAAKHRHCLRPQKPVGVGDQADREVIGRRWPQPTH